MTGWLKLLTVWLLALMLPAQSLASAVQQFCGHSSLPAQSLPYSTAPAAHVHHAAPQAVGAGAGADVNAASHADDAGYPMALADHQQAAPGGANDPADELSGHKCSACAACSAVAIPTTAATPLPAPEIGIEVARAPRPALPTVPADGPDRPPRIVLG